MRFLLLLPLFVSISIAAPQSLYNSNTSHAVVQQQQTSLANTNETHGTQGNQQPATVATTHNQQKPSLLRRLAALLRKIAASSAGTTTTATGRASTAASHPNGGGLGQILKRRNSELDINTSVRFSRLNNGVPAQGKTREYNWSFVSNPQGRASKGNNRRY